MSQKKSVLLIALLAMLVAPLRTFGSYNQTSAQNYLLSHADSAWSLMALSALDQKSTSVDFIKNISSTKAIDYEAPILALTSQGKNPKTFPSLDYVSKLKSFFSENQIGDASLLNDDYFGIIALLSSGVPSSDQIITKSKNYILVHQNQDGGFGWSTSSTSDSNDTAAAIMALKSAGVASTDQHIVSALNYLKSAQNSDGGFTYDPQSSFGTASDSSSTAWVLMAFNSLGINQSEWAKDGKTPKQYLEGNQTEGVFFASDSSDFSESPNFTKIVTAYSVIALSGKTLPIEILHEDAESKTYPFRIEGSEETVCEGKTEGPTALDVVKNAAKLCNFTYHITDYSFGPYLDTLGSDAGSGTSGWQYAINYAIPSKGASEYQLADNDEVLWYFGAFDLNFLQLSSAAQSAASGGNISATAKGKIAENWQNLEGAMIHAGAQTPLTDASGALDLSLPNGYYKIYATKPGFVRSGKILLKFGEPDESSVNLKVEVDAGSVLGDDSENPQDTVGFTVEPGNIDFGKLVKGQSASKQLKISNTSSGAITIQSQIGGDSVFIENLRLEDKSWQIFNATIAQSQNKEITAKLSLPANFTGASGIKSGQIIFWANPNN